MFCPVSRVRRHHQAGAPFVNIQSALCNAPAWCKNVSLAVSFGSGNLCMYTLGSQTCVCMCIYIYIYIHTYLYTHIFFIIQRCWSGQKNKKIGTTVSTACQRNFFAHHFGHACHRFSSPGIRQCKGQKSECLQIATKFGPSLLRQLSTNKQA